MSYRETGEIDEYIPPEMSALHKSSITEAPLNENRQYCVHLLLLH